MPEETRDELERSRRVREGMNKFTGVPDSWEGWAVRVLTVAVILTLITQGFLGKLTVDQTAFMRDSRDQRLEFQHEETARQCAILRNQRVSSDELRALKC